MITSVIVDDELRSRQTLTTLIERYCKDVCLLASAGDVSTGISTIKKNVPQLVFLDISMPDGSGFDLLDSFHDADFEVIFITAYNEYGIKAIKANAIDYLLKPLSINELQAAVSKASSRIHQKKLLNANVHNEEKATYKRTGKIAIPDHTGLKFVDSADIIYIEASGSYTKYHCINGQKIIRSRPLKDCEADLSEQHFIRVHHSYVINISHVISYEKGNGGTVKMSNGENVAISKRKKKTFLEIFNISV